MKNLVCRAPGAAVRARLSLSPLGPSRSRGWQIGPKIRIGGSVGNALGKVQKVLPSGGQLIGGVAGGIPGMMAGGAIDPNTSSLQKKIGAGVTAVAGGVAAAPLLAGAGGAAAAGAKALPGLLKSGGNKFMDLAGGLFGGGEGGGGGIMDKVLMGGAIASAAADGQRRDKMQDQAVDYAKSAYDANGGMRDSGRSMAMGAQAPDLSSVFANEGNVYDRQRRGVPTVSQKVPVSAAPTPALPLGPRVPVAAPQVLGQPATEAQAKDAFDNIQGVIQGGRGGMHQILAAARGALPQPPA